MMSEGFTEFLSFKAAKEVIADSIYQKKISDKIRSLKDFKPVPFAKVVSASDYMNRELYVYYYAPIIFTAIEKEIGEQKTWLWLRNILTTPAEHTNYRFLVSTLDAALQDKQKLLSIESKYFNSQASLQNAVAEIE